MTQWWKFFLFPFIILWSKLYLNFRKGSVSVVVLAAYEIVLIPWELGMISFKFFSRIVLINNLWVPSGRCSIKFKEKLIL